MRTVECAVNESCLAGRTTKPCQARRSSTVLALHGR